ncbi:MAG: hypothetical protein IBX70_08535 [Clostridia bacterium]|nr:hypothetical protein [Clostridia bacterium]
MTKCVCNSCKNLKSVVDESSMDVNVITEECVFGFPSEDCIVCELEGCELTCEHFQSMDDVAKYKTSRCITCGQELNFVSVDCEDDEVYCVACYLNK